MRTILTILAALCCLAAQAQESIPITLEKVLELGGANNLTIKEYQERQQLAQADLLKAKEWWLPELQAGAQAHRLGGAAMNGNGRFFLDVTRNNLGLGLGLNATWDFAEGIYATKAAEHQLKASEFHSQAERNQALLESINAYYDLMEAQFVLAAYSDMVAQADTITQQIQIQVDAGLRYESEVLLAKSNKNHLQVQELNAKRDYQTASAKLRTLLNLAPNVQLVSVDEALLPLDVSADQTTDPKTVYLDRPEFRAQSSDIEALRSKSKSYTTGLLLPEFNLSAGGSYFGRFNGAVEAMDPITFPETNQLYPTSLINASLMWKVPLAALTYDGDNQRYQSLIRLKEIQAEQFEAQAKEEVSMARMELEISREQITIAKEALELTAEALGQSMERQKLGTAIAFEVFQVQEMYLEAVVGYLTAVAGFNHGGYLVLVAEGGGL